MCTLFTAEQRKRLLANGCVSQEDEHDPYPVVKLFTPDANAAWLLSELVPEVPTIGFGLCDSGLGMPELGYVDLQEVASVRGRLGLTVERDRYFTADKRLSEYVRLSFLCEVSINPCSGI